MRRNDYSQASNIYFMLGSFSATCINLAFCVNLRDAGALTRCGKLLSVMRLTTPTGPSLSKPALIIYYRIRRDPVPSPRPAGRPSRRPTQRMCVSTERGRRTHPHHCTVYICELQSAPPGTLCSRTPASKLI